jgi:hypothetical protein
MVQIHAKNMHTLIAEKSGSALMERTILPSQRPSSVAGNVTLLNPATLAAGVETVSSSKNPCRTAAPLAACETFVEAPVDGCPGTACEISHPLGGLQILPSGLGRESEKEPFTV